jgi:CRISPR-associated protein Csm1
MLYHHSGDLNVALGAAIFDWTCLEDNSAFQARWQELGDAIVEDKRRRFATLDPAILASDVFAPRGHGGGIAAACVVCRFQGQIGSELHPFAPDEERELPLEDQRMICELCKSFDDLARDTHNARYLMMSVGEPRLPTTPRREAATTILRALGMDVRFARADTDLLRLLNTMKSARVLALRESASMELRRQFQGKRVVWGMRPTVNETPTFLRADQDALDIWLDAHPDEHVSNIVGAVKTFGVLVAQSTGVRRLGILRMDVDDLGDIFASALPRASLARIGALSASLTRFFEGWIGELCRQLNAQGPGGGRLYAIYSGGDDLFIAGSWDALPSLARTIREDLRAYARNEHIHMSGGLSLHPAKFPLYQAAEAAHEELERAKRRPGKDALGFLEQVIKWGSVADDLYRLQEQLATMIEDGKLPRATLQVLQELYSQYVLGRTEQHNWRPAERLLYGPWIWRGAYQLTRVADDLRTRHPDAAAFMYELRDRLLEGAKEPPDEARRFIERAGLAARWTQLLQRKEER